jgi:hypothetical protein
VNCQEHDIAFWREHLDDFAHEIHCSVSVFWPDVEGNGP